MRNRAFELVTNGIEPVTRGFILGAVTLRFKLVTCGFELATRGFDLVTHRFELTHLNFDSYF